MNINRERSNSKNTDKQFSELLKKHGEILKEIMLYHRQEAKETDNLLGDLITIYDSEKRILNFIVPETPPTLKLFARRLRGSSFDELHSYYNCRWYSLIQQAKMQIVKQDTPILPYKDAIIFIRLHEVGAVLRDVDSYAVYMIINALVRNNVIDDDNCDQMRYMYQVSGCVNQASNATSITIIENDSKWMSGSNCNDCIISRLVSEK